MTLSSLRDLKVRLGRAGLYLAGGRQNGNRYRVAHPSDEPRPPARILILDHLTAEIHAGQLDAGDAISIEVVADQLEITPSVGRLGIRSLPDQSTPLGETTLAVIGGGRARRRGVGRPGQTPRTWFATLVRRHLDAEVRVGRLASGATLRLAEIADRLGISAGASSTALRSLRDQRTGLGENDLVVVVGGGRNGRPFRLAGADEASPHPYD